MVDRRVKKKSGGYAIEKTASGKKMANTLGVTKDRKKATEGARSYNRLNKLNAKKKKIEGDIRRSAESVRLAEEQAAASGNKNKLTKEKKQLERRRGRVQKVEQQIKRAKKRSRTP